MSDKIVDAFRKAWKRTEENQWVYGRMGRVNPNGSYTFIVPGRKGFVYVRVRNSVGAQTTVPARNDGAVPHTANLPVKMKLEHGVYVIHSRTSRIDLNEEPDTPPSGVYEHAETHQHNGTDEVATATPAANAIPKADGSGLLDAWVTPPPVDSVNGQTGVVVLDSDDIAEGVTNLYFSAAEESKLAGIEAGADVTDAGNVGAAIHGASAKTTPVDADTMPLIDSEDGNLLKKVTWANIKATLKTYFDTLYATATGWIKADGTIPLTAEWDIGEDMSIRAERLEARDIEGLRLEDDGGNLGIHVGDGGHVGVGVAASATHELFVQKNQNAETAIAVMNDTAGTGATSLFRAINDVDLACLMGVYSSLTSTYKGIVASDAFLYATTNLRLITDAVGKVISLSANGASSPQAILSGSVLDLTVPIDANYGSSAGSILSETEGAAQTASVGAKAGSASATLTAYGASFATAGLGGNLAFGAIGGDFIIYTNGDVSSGGTNSVQFRVGGYGTNQERARLTTTGLGLGTTAPQSILHAHNGTGGMMFVTKTAVAGTDVTLIPNGTGDVVTQLYAQGMVLGSSAVNFAVWDWINVSSTRTLTTGGDSFRIRVNADGSVDCARTAGTQTYTVVLLLIWR